MFLKISILRKKKKKRLKTLQSYQQWTTWAVFKFHLTVKQQEEMQQG